MIRGILLSTLSMTLPARRNNDRNADGRGGSED